MGFSLIPKEKFINSTKKYNIISKQNYLKKKKKKKKKIRPFTLLLAVLGNRFYNSFC